MGASLGAFKINDVINPLVTMGYFRFLFLLSAPLLRNRLVSVKDLTDCIFNYCNLIPLINAFAFYRPKA